MWAEQGPRALHAGLVTTGPLEGTGNQQPLDPFQQLLVGEFAPIGSQILVDQVVPRIG